MLKGSLPFMADLMRQISLPLRIDLMEVSSYGGTATESSGLVRIIKDLSASIADEDVLLVEDIIDTGLTLNYLVRYLRGKNPASLRICTLLDKPARRLVDIPVDYVGFEIPDQFVVGYGLDYGERYRNLRFVGVLRPEVYTDSRLMHRRPLGNGRRLAIIGAVILLVGCVLPWYVGRGRRWPAARSCSGRSTGPGIVSFFAALATLALVALPYAAGERPVAIDRGISFAILAVAAVAGVVLFLFTSPGVLDALEGLLPDRAYGFWISALGAIIMARAAYDIWLEPPRR